MCGGCLPSPGNFLYHSKNAAGFLFGVAVEGEARVSHSSTGYLSVNAHLELTPFRSFRIDPR